MAKRKAKSSSGLEEAYRAVQPIAAGFAVELASQMTTLVDQQGISLGFPIEYRVKTWDSLEEKLQRTHIQLSDVRDLNDLVGLRVVLLFQRDIDSVCEAIEKTFQVIDKYDTQERLREDQFGYSSIHIIATLPDAWLSVPSFSKMSGFRAEIQVRTLAQHIWAAASHFLQYKRETSVPPPVRRSIHRVSALLETVDLELERVLSERAEYRSELEMSTEEPIPLDVDRLAFILSERLPTENRTGAEDYAELLEDLQLVGIHTDRQLEELIKAWVAAAKTADKKVVEARLATQSTVGTSPERLGRGVYYSHVGLVREMLDLAQPEWRKKRKAALGRG